MNIEARVRQLDRFQQRHRATAFVFGVIKKFGDDRGGALAGQITYYGFLSLFPLLLIFYTVMAYLLSSSTHTSFRRRC